MENNFGEFIKKLREEKGLLQREVCSLLEIDTPLLSKIERGERKAKKEQIYKFAQVLKTDPNLLVIEWLASEVYELVKNEECAEKVLKVVNEKIKVNRNG